MAISRNKKDSKKTSSRTASSAKPIKATKVASAAGASGAKFAKPAQAPKPLQASKSPKASQSSKSSKPSAASKAVQVVQSAKKAIAKVLKPAVAAAQKPSAKADKAALAKAASQKAGHQKTAKTPAIVEQAAAAQIANIAPVKGKKGMVLAVQAAAPVVAGAGKKLKGARASSKKASEAKKYSGAILLKFEDGTCREMTCETTATTGQYCRMHYIKNWKLIKQREQILKEGKLDRFIAELVAKYPDKYIEAIRFDLAHDQEFAKVIADLEIEDASDSSEEFGDDEDAGAEHLIDNIRRDFTEAEGESF